MIDLEFREEGIEAVYLLLFLHKSIVLRDASERQFVHQVDLIRAVHILVGESLDEPILVLLAVKSDDERFK